jgi:hypothetical protein
LGLVDEGVLEPLADVFILVCLLLLSIVVVTGVRGASNASQTSGMMRFSSPGSATNVVASGQAIISVSAASQTGAVIAVEDSEGRSSTSGYGKADLDRWLNAVEGRIRKASVRHLIVEIPAADKAPMSVLQACLIVQAWLTSRELDAQVYLVEVN